MIEAGLLLGLFREISTQLVVQTCSAPHSRCETSDAPGRTREMVISPGGTTTAAIRELEIAGVRAATLNAIQAAMVALARTGRGPLVVRLQLQNS